MAEFIRNERNGVVYYTSPQLESSRFIRHAYFTRKGGVSEGRYASLNFRLNGGDDYENAVKNHIIGGSVIGAKPQNIVCTHQQHTDIIRVIKGSYSDDFPHGFALDAIVTDVPGLCLTAYYADCQVVMIFDRKKKVAAIVHAGWKGVANGIVSKTVVKMQEHWGCNTADLIASIGPSICRGCFETDEDVPRLMMETYDSFVSEYIYKEEFKWHVDLKNITYSSLLKLGVPAINIDVSNICTVCTHEPDLWWSQRRNGDNRGVQGAMLMIK